MKGLNFLVFRFSSLPLNTGVYIFQVPVSFPLSSLKNPYEFSSPAWGGFGSSEGSFVFNVPVWLRDHVPRNGLKVLTNFKYPTECANIRRLHNIFLVWHQALVWEGQDYLWKSASKVSKKVQFGTLFLALGIDWRCFWGGLIFPGLLPVTCFLWKMPFWNTYFCLKKLINSSQDCELLCKNFWNGLKTVFPNPLQFFRKNAIKIKMLFSKQPNELGFLMHPKLMHQILNFSDAPDKKCLCAPRA